MVKAAKAILGLFIGLSILISGVAIAADGTDILDFLPAIIKKRVTVPKYFYQDLGDLGGGSAWAFGISSNGLVAGESTTITGVKHAFLWTPSGGMQDLGILAPGDESSARDINSTGQVVGVSNPIGVQLGSRAFLWTPTGGMQDLGTLGGLPSFAVVINDNGQVVGSSKTSAGPTHAFLWTLSGGMHDLGTLGGTSYAYNISSSGLVVGQSSTITGDDHAFLWAPSGGMIDLGTLVGENRSAANDINSSGQIVGDSDLSHGNPRAFLWTPFQGMKDLGTLGKGDSAMARGINSSGQVVGHDLSFSNGNEYAFLWTLAGGMKDLNSLVNNLPSGISLSDTKAINDAGQIVGGTSEGRAFLLTPIP